MYNKRIAKLNIILFFSVIINLFYSSNSLAQYSQIVDICKDENKRRSYGFSIEKCSVYLKEHEKSIKAQKIEYVKRLESNIQYYQKNERFMIAVLYMKELLPFLEEAGDIDTYNNYVDTINIVYDECNEYANTLNMYNNNNIHNSVIGFVNTLQGQDNLSNNLRNFQNVMDYEKRKKQYLYHCGAEE